jgi:hypothetical protein
MTTKSQCLVSKYAWWMLSLYHCYCLIKAVILKKHIIVQGMLLEWKKKIVKHSLHSSYTTTRASQGGDGRRPSTQIMLSSTEACADGNRRHLAVGTTKPRHIWADRRHRSGPARRFCRAIGTGLVGPAGGLTALSSGRTLCRRQSHRHNPYDQPAVGRHASKCTTMPTAMPLPTTTSQQDHHHHIEGRNIVII